MTFSGKSLVRNVAYNLAGAILPMVVAIWAIPVLIGGYGKERFGILTIIWIGVGYFSLFDMGIGRALTKLIAERLGDGRDAEIPGLIRIGLRAMLISGGVAGILVLALAPWLTSGILKIPQDLVVETFWSLVLLAPALPLVVSSAGLTGVLQAYQRFAAINAIRMPLGLITFLGPVVVLQFSRSLVAATGVLIFSRFVAWLLFYLLCSRYRRSVESSNMIHGQLRQLLSFGGWITVSNLVGPLMVYFDRFLLGSMLGMVAVTYYTTPYEVITRLAVIPDAIVCVMFPVVTTALAAGSAHVRRLTAQVTRSLLLIMAVPVGLSLLFAPELLKLWLGGEFVAQSTSVLRWLALGIFANSLARLPYNFLQSAGRPDLTAKLLLIELPFYFVTLFFLVQKNGIVGAAAAWTLRSFADMVVLYLLTMRNVYGLRWVQLVSLSATIATSGILALLVLADRLEVKLVAASALLAIAGGLAVRELHHVRVNVAASAGTGNTDIT